MGKIIELRAKRAEIWDKAKKFLDEKQDGDGILNAEDTAIYNKFEKDITDLGSAIDRLERQAELDKQLSAATGQEPIKNTPAGADGADGAEKQGRASNMYKKAFWNAMRGRIDISVTNALSVGVDSEGGYTVPDEFERQLIEALEEENLMRRLANVIQTAHGDRKIPVVATKGQAYWIEEGQPYIESDDSFAQVTISAYKVGTLMKISEELLNDSIFNLEQYTAREFARRIAVKEEEAFFVGSGDGQPKGVLADDGGAEIGVESTKTDEITLDDVIDLFYSLRAPYRNRAVFVMNDSSVKAIRKLKDASGQYLWQPSIKDATPDTILNRPLYTSAFMPPIEAGEKSMIFGDFRYYWIADRQGRTFRRLNELYATTGQVGFIAMQRVDGRLILPEALKVLQQAEAE